MKTARPLLALALATTLAAVALPDEPPPPTGAAVLDEVKKLMDGHTDRTEEERILELLRTCAPDALEHLVRHVDVAALLGDVDDHLGGPYHRTALLALLARARLDALSIAARAELVTALQVGSTSEEDERAIRDVFLGTRGADLSALKDAVDGGGDYHDLEQLIFHDLDDEALTTEILAHFTSEAAIATSTELKVMSDIDDTLFRNWCDERYPPKAVYPGILSLHRELDLGNDGAGRPGDITFLTARPGDRPGLVENQTIHTLGQLGVPRCVVLTGTIDNILTNEAIAEGKLAAFGRYRRLYPERKFVFTGDSGQGDAIVAARMMADHADAMRGVFIHDVVHTPDGGRKDWATKRVPLFDTYVGAAVHAHNLQLISQAGLQRVAQAAFEELAKLTFATDVIRDARRAELQRDIALANALLPEGSRVGE